ncbi:MAG: DUF1292 domain-containing protein [Defluviitaleaceae bacterium]|nr:DUF1292 domain-containing protein [Defluviitaleaceae bacterium]
MNSNENQITAITEDNKEVIFEVIDTAIYKDNMYMIVTENNIENGEATILKQIKSEENYITYSFVEEDEEFEKVMEIFMDNDEFDFIL